MDIEEEETTIAGTESPEVDPKELFKPLTDLVTSALEDEITQANARGEIPASKLSVKDLNFRDTVSRPETVRLDIVESWNDLMNALNEELVYYEYVNLLEKAFLTVYSTVNGRRIKTLLDLLTQSVKEHARDNSIECRFVTLLEVTLSYAPHWEPSDEVAACWIRLMQRIPTNIAPVNFRRRAYRVLVSLSWVPSSKGLLEACSFEESKQSLNFQKERVCEHMAQIRGGPLPRYDCMNQMLDRLKDETDVCVAITSEKQGLGKTTLAAQVASHPSIQRVFTVLWLNIQPQKSLSYDIYLKHLTDLCDQLKFDKQQWPIDLKRFEEPALRRLREQARMKAAKEQMSNLMSEYSNNVLLILDDVRDSNVIDWFRFSNRQSVILTTLNPDMDCVDWVLELAPMCEEEAVELFLREAGLPGTHILGSTVETRSIVKHCDYNPLTVRAVARWFQLKHVTAGIAASIEEIIDDLNTLTTTPTNNSSVEADFEDHPNMMLFDVLSLMMGPSRTKEKDALSAIFVLCFAAHVVVFPDEVPLDALLLLWEQILRNEQLAVDELGDIDDSEINKLGWLTAEGLAYMGVMGVIDRDGTPWVRVHHTLHKEFAILMAREMDLKETFQETAADWHMAFVTGYFSRKSQGVDEKHDSSWEYTIAKLPSHMFEGKMSSTAEIVLVEENFFRARIQAMGWRRGIETQIEDCVQLQHDLEEECEANGEQATASIVFSQTASLLRDKRIGLADMPDEQSAFEEARAEYLIGFALAENGYFEEALEHFEGAEELVLYSPTLQASILYATGYCLLELNQPGRAKNKINASRKIMDLGAAKHGLYREMQQVYADALVATCNYREAANFFDGIVALMKADRENNPIEYGTTLFRYGRLCYLMGDIFYARSVLEECIHWKVNSGENSRSLSAAYSLLGDILIELGLVCEAKDRYESALITLEALNCDEQHLDYRLLKGKVQFLRHDFTGCQRSFDLVRRTIIESPLTFMDQSAYDLRNIARAYENRDDLDTAIVVLRESLELTKDHKFSLERAWSNIALGNCLIKLGEDREALVCFEEAREIQSVKLGESTEVIDTMNLIGSIHLALGDNTAALEIFRKNFESTKNVAPDDIERIAGVLYLIGDTCAAQGSYSEAGSYFREVIEVLMRDRKPDHPDIAKTLQRLGDVTASENDFDRAYQYYTKALKIRRMGFDESLVAESVFSLGVISRKRNEHEQAQNFLSEALEIRRRVGDSFDVSEVLLELGNVYRICSQLEKARKAYQEAMDLLDDRDFLYDEVQLAIGHVKLSSGDYEGALADYECVRLNRLVLYNKDDIHTGNASRSMGMANFLMGRSDDAWEHLGEFVGVCEQIGGNHKESAGYVLALLLLGDIAEASNRLDEAYSYWRRGKEIFDEIDEVREKLPALITPMFDRRLGGDGDNNGYLSRCMEKLVNDAPKDDCDDEEIALQKVVFLDD